MKVFKKRQDGHLSGMEQLPALSRELDYMPSKMAFHEFPASMQRGGCPRIA